MWKAVLIEDEDLLRDGLIRAVPWAELGFEMAGSAEDGLAGLELVERARPDVVFTDVHMAKMNGLAMAEKIRERYPQMFLVFISGYDEFEYARRALKLGAEEYILKPVRLEEVEEALRRIAKQLEERREREAEYRELKKLEEQYRGQREEPEGADAAGMRTSLERAIDYMRRECGNENLMIANVAEYAQISSSYLSMLIKKETGKTFTEYLTDIRMECARRLLLKTPWKISDVAQACGFANATYFSTVFKNRYGMSPSSFRQQNLENTMAKIEDF